jgi:hypothetical protein
MRSTGRDGTGLDGVPVLGATLVFGAAFEGGIGSVRAVGMGTGVPAAWAFNSGMEQILAAGTTVSLSGSVETTLPDV